MKIAINKKTVTTAVYTISMLSAIYFAMYPTTNSYFIKERDNVIAYSSELDYPYQNQFGVDLLETESTPTEAIFSLTITRDKRYMPNDIYRLDMKNGIDNACEIIEHSETLNVDENNQDITFSSKETEVVKVKCKVKENVNLNITTKLYERVLTEDEFLYKIGKGKEDNLTYEEYLTHVKLPEGITTPTTEQEKLNAYTKFLQLVQAHITETGYNKLTHDLALYINKYGITANNIDTTLFGTDANFNFLGITRVETEDKTGYTFLFDKNFIGYLRVKDYYKDTSALRIYFSSEDSDDIKQAFDNSITNWGFNTDEIKIGNTPYTTKELVKKYVEEYLKEKKLPYTLDNIDSVPGITKGGASDPYLDFDNTILNDAYNYLTRDPKIIRINHKNSINGNINYRYVRNVVKNISSSIQTENNEKLFTILTTDLDDKTSPLAVSATCTTGCSDYQKIYYVNNKFFEVKILHKATYNELIINETTKEELETNNIVLTALNEKEDIKCTENCNDYEQIFFHNNEYYKVSVSHRKLKEGTLYTPFNEVSITKISDLKSNLTGYDANVVEAINSSLTSNTTLLNKAITCTTNCKTYSETYYNSVNETEKYTSISIIPENNNIKRITLEKAQSFIIASASEELKESIMVGLTDGSLESNITSYRRNYYEIHYDKQSDSYLLLKVKKDSTNSVIVISTIVIKSSNDTAITQEAIEELSGFREIYIFTKNAYNLKINEDLIKYLGLSDTNEIETSPCDTYPAYSLTFIY